jgi:hypothetical protein
MMDMLRIPLAVHNLHGPDPSTGRRRVSIREFLQKSHAGVGGFNELKKGDRSFFKAEAAKQGLRVYIAGFDGVVWDPSKLKAGRPRRRKIMQGGYVGLDEVATPKKGDDDRRLGPSAYAIYMPFTVNDFPLEFEFVVTHLMSMAFTRAKWRQPLFYRSVHRLADGVLDPNGLLVGDMNSIDYIDLPGVRDSPVPVPSDMGKKRYTQIIYWGNRLSVSKIQDINTPSDHDLLVGTLTLFEKLSASPKPVKPSQPQSNLPKPGTKAQWRKYGAPVRHPWVKRSNQWRRRHSRLWARIVKWRAAYYRRLS